MGRTIHDKIQGVIYNLVSTLNIIPLFVAAFLVSTPIFGCCFSIIYGNGIFTKLVHQQRHYFFFGSNDIFKVCTTILKTALSHAKVCWETALSLKNNLFQRVLYITLCRKYVLMYKLMKYLKNV